MSKPPNTGQTQPTFDVRLQALPCDDDADATRRLRAELKTPLLRDRTGSE